MLLTKKIQQTFFYTVFLLASLFFVFINQAFARENVTDWYIKDFQTKIEIFADDSAIITEDIVADCGTARDKHGIFRILPIQSTTPDGIIYTPIELISITDFKGQSHPYQEIIKNNTITWKIGSANTKVSGENYYRIKYKVLNVIRDQNTFDEFYWNLSGNYWDLEIDKFQATIILIPQINQDNTNITLYSGVLNNKDNKLTTYNWLDNNILEINTNKTLTPNEGVTISLSFPKNYIQHQVIATQYNDSKQSALNYISEEMPYSSPLFSFIIAILYIFILPIIVFIIAFVAHKRQQKKNPYYKNSLVTTYSPPANISPIMLGFIDKGGIQAHLITASIIKMATLKLLTIKEQTKKVMFIETSILEFVKNNNQENYQQLDEAEKYIFQLLFKKGEQVSINQLKNNFTYLELRAIQKIVKTEAQNENYLLSKINKLKKRYLIWAIVLLLTGSIVPAIILFIFYNINKNLTQEGQKLYWEIQGFKQYMTIAEKERHGFYEKENIFTKLLPYSIAIGNVKEWVKKMADIYGEEYIQKSFYWYAGASTLNSLNAIDSLNNITSQIDSIANSINKSISSNSGHGGSGSSGGGSGGGGGGGW